MPNEQANMLEIRPRDQHHIGFKAWLAAAAKLAENVPKMSRKCNKWIKLVKLIIKVVLDAQNA